MEDASMSEYPKELRYTTSHVWAKVDPKKRQARIGVTDELTTRLREILSIDMPMLGDELEMDAPCLHIHRATSIFNLPSPLTGRIVEINRDVLDNPDLLFLEPYRHWLFVMEYDEEDELDMLMNASQYQSHLDTL